MINSIVNNQNILNSMYENIENEVTSFSMYETMKFTNFKKIWSLPKLLIQILKYFYNKFKYLYFTYTYKIDLKNTMFIIIIVLLILVTILIII